MFLHINVCEPFCGECICHYLASSLLVELLEALDLAIADSEEVYAV